jgi:tetratricopeptide (TPR) repeat protein
MRYLVWLAVVCSIGPGLCQTSAPAVKARPPQPDLTATAKLLETGNCPAGLPLAKKAYASATDLDMKRRLGVGGVRCALALHQVGGAAALIDALNQDFKDDPDVLYLTVHTYSDLALRASQTLLFKHPDAYQVHQLNAESLEAQGRWDDAAQEYRTILERNATLPGIHYRIGRLILSAPATPKTEEEARREFEAELKINPNNAGAEFVLGELARNAGQFADAAAHFSRATQLDASFADAFLGLGRALLSDDKPAQAIVPLETATRLQPANPATHFQLANAYRRMGRKADADREYLAHKQTSETARQTSDELRKAVGGAPGASAVK